jgi:hypothetical protein
MEAERNLQLAALLGSIEDGSSFQMDDRTIRLIQPVTIALPGAMGSG